MDARKRKVAIVYDWIDKWGGVERLLKVLHEMYPEAPFYTSYLDENSAKWSEGMRIIPSFIQFLPKWIRKSRLFSFVFYPFAFESFDFSSYDLVISVTSSFAKAVVTKPETTHICILLTPTRYLWLYPSYYLGSFMQRILQPFLSYIKYWDRLASKRPDKMISISASVARRCSKYYGLDSDVLYPPFDIDYWKGIKEGLLLKKSKLPEKYYLVVSRLEPYKKVEMVIEAFSGIKTHKLIVVGKGSQLQILKERAKSKNIIFMQDQSDEELGRLYMNAQALIMPQVEDFGYTAVEAQFFGCPVIALNQGGVPEIIHDGQSGLLFSPQTVPALRGVLERYDKISYNLKHKTRATGGNQAQQFAKELFKEKFWNIINSPF